MKRAAPPILAALLFAGLFTATVAPHDRVSTRLSWDGDVQRIVDARCVSCHARPRDRNVPDLSTYASARPWARAVRQAILEGHAYSAASGAALTPFERELLVQWIDGGAPQKPKFFPVEFSRLPEGYVRLASADPLKTLEEHRARHGGTRSIIPGLGLALRAPDRIIVVDRAAEGERLVARGTFVPSVAAHLASLPASTVRTRLSDTAYIVGDAREPRAEVAEIAPDGPDRFWCQMHPDVRSPIAGTCPRCAMKLTAIPPMKLDAFGLDVERVAPIGGVPFVMTRITRGSPARVMDTGEFLFVHEERLHMFVVDEQLQFFEHAHPVHMGRSAFSVNLPRAGRYRVIADFAPVDAMPQMRMAPFTYDGAAAAAAPADQSTLSASLDAPALIAGRAGRIAFQIRDAASGGEPQNLEPYLGAAAHLFVIDETLENPMHAHPQEVGEGGMARPAFDVRFPRAGRYVMWLQVQRAGRVETMRFTADVSR